MSNNILNTPNSTKKATRAEVALTTISADKMSSLLTVGARYSESTIKKHSWVIRIYEGFCQALNISAWPLDKVYASGFVRFLGLEAKYAIGSIEDVIIPSLKRLHMEKTDQAVSLEISQFMSQALKDIKNSKSQLDCTEGRDAAIITDVQRIINSTPDGIPTKAAEASLWLTAVSTGARAITCFSVQLGDIKNVYSKNNNTNLLVQICFKVTKGNPNWNHYVTLEGDINKRSSINVVYWLNEHLKSKFNLDLSTFNSWNTGNKEQQLWNWSKDSMRELFKSRAILAGFPSKLFTFHSLRSGFICSALLKAGSDSNAVKAILENTAFVAGWVPNQAAQLRYVKDCAKKTIISSRLILPTEENLDTNVIDTFLSTSEAFHNIKLVKPTWPTDSNYKAFYKVINNFIKEKLVNIPDSKNFQLRFWTNSFYLFVKKTPKLARKAKKLCKEEDRWYMPNFKNFTEKHICQTVGREFIADQLNTNFGLLSEFTSKFKQYILIELDKENAFKRYKGKEKITKECTRERYSQTGQRKRIPWSEEEDSILINSKKDEKLWLEISELLDSDRTNVDCKDRWRNLLKKHGTAEEVFKQVQ
jgi:3-methyladenine DNA glycosylase AlkC